MPVLHPASGLALLDATRAVSDVATAPSALWPALIKPIPVPVGVGLWQARQSALPELLITRKSGLLGSIFCTCGLWQLVHSTFPLIKRTAPVGSAVEGGLAVKEATRSPEAFNGRVKLMGC